VLLAIAALAVSRREIAISTNGAAFQLPDSFIVAESETILCAGNPLDRETYSLDGLRGSLRFLESPDCDSLTVIYRFLDLEIPLSIFHQAPRGAGGQLVERRPRINIGMDPENNRLVHSGSLLRGIKIGSRRDASMESAFQLEAYGGIGENIEITALLSDQDLPIQPEGTSEKLAQLDQVHIGVKGPFFEAVFGDFTANFASGEFAAYSRRLSGVQLKGFSKRVTGEAVGAVLEGAWSSQEFACVEGNQGPYQITVSAGAVQILAGTETVWLNGEKVRRGQDNDYTIDYNLGQITFTTNRPVGEKDRVVVDFQYTDLDFRRSFYGASGMIEPIERLRFDYSVMLEADDSRNPLTTEFSELDLAAIARAGDSADSAYITSASLSDSGSYFLADSATENEHFQWAGEGAGNWSVQFTYVGSGKGDYNYISAGRYEWVGAGLGSYRPIRRLPLPASHSLLGFGAVFEVAESVSVSGEIASSSLDRNRLSDLNDGDNTGGAYSLKLDLNREVGLFGKQLGRAAVGGRIRHKAPNFATIGRLDEAEFKRDWGLSGATGAEDIAEAQVTYIPTPPLSIGGSLGRNTVGAETRDRMASSVSLRTDKLSVSANSSRISSDWFWDKYWGDISAKLWRFTPKIKARFEDKTGTEGFRFYEFFNEVGIKAAERLSFSPGFDLRKDELRGETGLAPESEVRTIRLTSQIYDWKLTANHREYKDLSGLSSDIKSDLARIEGTIKLSVPKSDLRVRYELSKKQSEVLQPVFDYVGTGAGNYEYDPDRNEYIPSTGGDYLKRYLPTGDFTPAVGSDLRGNLSLDLSNLETRRTSLRFLKLLSFDGLVKSEGSYSSESAKAYLANPSTMLEDSDLLSGQFSAEGNLKIGARRPRGLTMRRKYSQSRSAQFTTGEEIRKSGEYSIEGRANSALGSFISSVKFTETTRLYPEDSRTGTEISGCGVDISWSRLIKSKFQSGVSISFLSETDKWPVQDVRIVRRGVSPSSSYFFEGGNLRADLMYSRVSASDDFAGILPYDMAQGDFIGNNGRITLSANIDIATGTMMTLSYELISRSGRLPEHTAGASVRIIF